MKRLRKTDLDRDLGLYLVIGEGESPISFDTLEEATAHAKREAEEWPDMAFAVFELKHLALARMVKRVKPVRLYGPPRAER